MFETQNSHKVTLNRDKTATTWPQRDTEQLQIDETVLQINAKVLQRYAD